MPISQYAGIVRRGTRVPVCSAFWAVDVRVSRMRKSASALSDPGKSTDTRAHHGVAEEGLAKRV